MLKGIKAIYNKYYKHIVIGMPLSAVVIVGLLVWACSTANTLVGVEAWWAIFKLTVALLCFGWGFWLIYKVADYYAMRGEEG